MPISPENRFGQNQDAKQGPVVRIAGRKRSNSTVASVALRVGAAATFFVVAGAGSVYGFVRAYDQENPNLPAHGHFGDLIAGETLKQYVVDSADGSNFVAVKRKPSGSQKDIIGYVKNKQVLAAQPVLGPTYPSYPESLGKFEQGGIYYGHWYQVVTLMHTKDKSGNLVPKMDPRIGIQVTEKGYIMGTDLVAKPTLR